MSRKPNEFIDDEENNEYYDSGIEPQKDQGDDFFLEEPEELEDSYGVVDEEDDDNEFSDMSEMS